MNSWVRSWIHHGSSWVYWCLSLKVYQRISIPPISCSWMTQHWCSSRRSTRFHLRTGKYLDTLVHRDIQVTTISFRALDVSMWWEGWWFCIKSITYFDFTSLTYHILRFGCKTFFKRWYFTPELSKLGPLEGHQNAKF